jgi:hypothetical protein
MVENAFQIFTKTFHELHGKIELDVAISLTLLSIVALNYIIYFLDER